MINKSQTTTDKIAKKKHKMDITLPERLNNRMINKAIKNT